jgi:hypothetical protein
MFRTVRTIALIAVALGLIGCEKEIPPVDREVGGEGHEAMKPVDDQATGQSTVASAQGAADTDQPAAWDSSLPRTYAPQDISAEPGTLERRMPAAGATPPAAMMDEVDPASDPTGCAALGPKMVEIAMAQLEEQIPDPAQRAQMAPMVAQARGQLIQQCQTEKWSKAAKDCIRNADPKSGFEACEEEIFKSRIEQARSDAKAELATADPKKVATCTPVAKKLARLAQEGMLQQATGAREKALARQVLGPLEMQLTAQCAAEDWSAEARTCLMDAKSVAETAPCQQLLPRPGGLGGGAPAGHGGGAPAGHGPHDGHGH